ncbi:MAG: protein kinase [Acidimicrobiales bacterium]
MDQQLIAAALPNYELGEEIGRGGWGIVYRAYHPSLQRHVAVKVLPRAFGVDEVTRDRFREEARLGAMLDHPHIVKVYDLIEHEGLWLIVMDRLGGGTLWERFTAQGLMSDEVCAIALGLCAALEAAHEREVVHRDVKPENLLFTDDMTPCLGDFGVAKALDLGRARTAAGEVVGTPAYMSPEQARGTKLTPESDVYSAGVLLYEALSGRLPFPDAPDPMAMLLKHVSEPPPPLSEVAPQVPAEIADVVMRCLEKDPADRFRSGGALGEAIARAANKVFGFRWLNHTGIGFRAWGPIAEILARPSDQPPAMRPPTTSMPAVRDHMRAGTQIDSEPTSGSKKDEVEAYSSPAQAPEVEAKAAVDEPDRMATIAPKSIPPFPAEPSAPLSGVAEQRPAIRPDSPDDPNRPTPRPLRLSKSAKAEPEDLGDVLASAGPKKVLIGAGAALVALAIAAGVYFGLLAGGDDDQNAATTTSTTPTTEPTSPSSTEPVASSTTDAAAALEGDALALASRYTDRCTADGGITAECLCQFLVLIDQEANEGLSVPIEQLTDQYEQTGELPDDAVAVLNGRCERPDVPTSQP